MQEGLDAFKSGQVAMQMNWFAFFPGLYKDPNVGGDKIGFFVNPGAEGRGLARSAARASRSSPTRRTRTRRSQYIKWFAQPDVQKKWWALGGYSCHKAVLQRPGLPEDARRSRPTSSTAMGEREGLLAGAGLRRSCCSAMQKRVHDYVVADKGTAKEALDGLVEDWTEGLQGRRQDLSRSTAGPARRRARPAGADADPRAGPRPP